MPNCDEVYMSDVWQAAFNLLGRFDLSSVAVDAGAHHGQSSLAVRNAFPGIELHSFEPNPDAYQHLRNSLYGLDRVILHEVALSDEDGRALFYKGNADFTSSLMPRNSQGRRYFQSDFTMKEEVYVPTTKLDTYCAAACLPRINLLKVDTQGAELKVLNGSIGLLRESRIDVILSEFFCVSHYDGAPLLPEIWSFLEANGYSLFDFFKGAVGTNGQARYGDAIFVSPSVRRMLDSLPKEP